MLLAGISDVPKNAYRSACYEPQRRLPRSLDGCLAARRRRGHGWVSRPLGYMDDGPALWLGPGRAHALRTLRVRRRAARRARGRCRGRGAADEASASGGGVLMTARKPACLDTFSCASGTGNSDDVTPCLTGD